jgi:hypothetical protein
VAARDQWLHHPQKDAIASVPLDDAEIRAGRARLFVKNVDLRSDKAAPAERRVGHHHLEHRRLERDTPAGELPQEKTGRGYDPPMAVSTAMKKSSRRVPGREWRRRRAISPSPPTASLSAAYLSASASLPTGRTSNPSGISPDGFMCIRLYTALHARLQPLPPSAAARYLHAHGKPCADNLFSPGIR